MGEYLKGYEVGFAAGLAAGTAAHTPFPNPFKVGQHVRRRLGTLGGTGKEGIVRDIVMLDDHECLTVDFGDRVETFIWSTYETSH